MKCRDCGAEISPYSKKCTKCGREIVAEEKVVTRYSEKVSVKKEKKRWYIPVIASSALVIGAVTLLFIWKGNQDRTPKEPEYLFYWNESDLIAYDLNHDYEKVLEVRDEETKQFATANSSGWRMKYQMMNDNKRMVFATAYTASYLEEDVSFYSISYKAYFVDLSGEEEPQLIDENMNEWFVCGEQGIVYNKFVVDEYGIYSNDEFYYYDFGTKKREKIPFHNVVGVSGDGTRLLYNDEEQFGTVDTATFTQTKVIETEEVFSVHCSTDMNDIVYVTSDGELFQVKNLGEKVHIANNVEDIRVNFDGEQPVIFCLQNNNAIGFYNDGCYVVTNGGEETADELYCYEGNESKLLLENVEFFDRSQPNGFETQSCIVRNGSDVENKDGEEPNYDTYVFDSERAWKVPEGFELYNVDENRKRIYYVENGVLCGTSYAEDSKEKLLSVKLNSTQYRLEYLQGVDLLVKDGEGSYCFYNEKAQKKEIPNYRPNTCRYDEENDCYYLLQYEKNQSVLYKLTNQLILTKIVENVNEFWLGEDGKLVTLENESLYLYKTPDKKVLIGEQVKGIASK